MWRSTGVRAGDYKMIGVHRTLLLDVKKHWSQSRRQENVHGEEHVYSYILFSPALPKCFSISITNDSYTLTMLLSPALTSVLPYMHESSHMCSDILLSPALTPVLLLIYQQCSMYSNHFTISCSNCIASPHARAMSCVL